MYVNYYIWYSEHMSVHVEKMYHIGAIREMRVKTTLRCHTTYKMAII